VFKNSLKPVDAFVKVFLNTFKTKESLGRSLRFYNMGLAAIMGD
jgi:hypothetical protein